MTDRFLSHAALARLVDELVAAHTRVIAPARAEDNAEQLDYMPIGSLDEASFGVRLPRRSLKEFFLPASEVILRYEVTKAGVELKEVPLTAAPQLILGASPCDVAALEIVDKVMDWDYRDELWFARRQATTIVTFLCPLMDSTCFCTAVGLGPESTRGSDAMLIPVEGGYLARVMTEKGDALLAGYASDDCSDALVAQAGLAEAKARRKVEPNMPAIPADFSSWLAGNFEHAAWKTMALRCHGCGACAGICPTCHCFDIVDEHESAERGVRRRNWDSCQTARFTMHASGHNPRGSQSERFRQRVQHKFSIYPSRFGEILCTGCGRCSRCCPGGMNLAEVLGDLRSLALKAEEGEG